MIILIGSQKGGCGKSTMLSNLAVALQQLKADLIVVDADRQGTVSNWVEERSQQGVSKINLVQKYDNIRDTLLDLRTRYDYVLVDTAGRDSRELRTGLTAADLLLAPFRPSQPDLDTMHYLQDLVTQAQDLNPGLDAKAILTMASTNPVVNEVKESQDYLEQYPNIELLNSVIRDRKIYRDAISEGLGILETSNRKANEEFQALVEELTDLIKEKQHAKNQAA